MYGTLYGKRDFAARIKLGVLRWKDYPELFSQAYCDHKCSYKQEVGGLEWN
jgi:hypothetical protein